MSKWQTILDAIETAMEATTGFSATTVTVNAAPPGTLSSTIQMNIVDHAPEVEPQSINGEWTWKLPVDLELYIANGTSSLTNLRTALENILTKISTNYTWSGNATLTEIQVTEKEVVQQEYQQAIIVVQLSVQYSTNEYAV